MGAASVAFAGALRLFTSGVLPWAFGAVRLPSEMEQPIVRDSREAGARVTEVWSSPVAPAALPLGGAILLAGRRAIVWEPLTGLPPSQLAAAIALRGTRARGWPLALGGSALALLTIVLTRAEGTSVPALAVLGPIGAMCAIAFVDVLERIRVRTADRSGSRAEEHIRGLLAASRAHARLAAGGALTPAEVVLPGLALSTWERAIRLARRIAEDAGLEPEVVDTIVIEIVAAEAPRARKEAPQEPVEPITARRKVAPRKKVVPRKKAAPRKKPVRKAVSGRASARSTRRSRP